MVLRFMLSGVVESTSVGRNPTSLVDFRLIIFGIVVREDGYRRACGSVLCKTRCESETGIRENGNAARGKREGRFNWNAAEKRGKKYRSKIMRCWTRNRGLGSLLVSEQFVGLG